jgi:hypothetical protein
VALCRCVVSGVHITVAALSVAIIWSGTRNLLGRREAREFGRRSGMVNVVFDPAVVKVQPDGAGGSSAGIQLEWEEPCARPPWRSPDRLPWPL